MHGLLDLALEHDGRSYDRVVETLFLGAWKGMEGELWREIEGLERRKTALSDHLLELFEGWNPRFAGLAPNFTRTFERFELLASLAHFERNETADVARVLSGQPPNNWVWMPMGRIGWHRAAEQAIAELRLEPLRTSLLEAGFARGDATVFDLFAQNAARMVARMRW